MGAFDLQNPLSLMEEAAAVVFLISLVALILARQSRARPKPDAARLPTPEFGSVKRTDARATPAGPTPQPVAPPARVAVPQSAAPAPLQSYAAIAAAQAARSAPSPAAAQTREVIDYSDALTGIRPDASYTAAAIASLLGIAVKSNGASTETHAGETGESYAAIAARSGPPTPRTTAPTATRIDYSREAIELPPNASYAAIAVATAAHRH